MTTNWVSHLETCIERPRDRDISVRLWLLLIWGLFGVDLLGACDADRASDGDPSTCYQPTTYSAMVPACAATRLCLASPQAEVVDGAHCTAQTCRFTYQKNAGDTLTYDGGNTWVFLRFAGSIVGATTTDQLTAAFQHVNFYKLYPVSGSPSAQPAMYFEQRASIDGFERFEFVAGRLHVRLTFTVRNPYASISSSDSHCNAGDIIGMCNCVYDGIDELATIDVDLPADVPGQL